MAQGYSDEYKRAVVDKGTNNGSTVNAGLRVMRATLPLDGTAIKGADGDTNLIARLPPGVSVQKIEVVSSVSLTTTTLAFGVTGNAGKYGAAKAYGTTPNTIVPYVSAAAKKDAISNTPIDVLMTVATAALPTTAGAVLVVDIIYSARG